MINLPENVALPMKADKNGDIRISGTRVTLDSIINYYTQGESPEDLHEGFPTVPLSDIYAIIGYYLAHRDEVDVYLKEREEEASRIQQEVESNYSSEQKAHSERLRKLLTEKRK